MMDNQQVVSVFYEGQDDLADILAVSIVEFVLLIKNYWKV